MAENDKYNGDPPPEPPDWVEEQDQEENDEKAFWERERDEYENQKETEFWARVKERLNGEETGVRRFKPFGQNFAHPMLIDDFIWTNTITFLYGDAGTGKSWVALTMATCMSLGIPFLGHDSEQRRTLYVDTELSYEDLSFRAEAVARGLGRSEASPWLFYWRLPVGATLANPGIIKALREKMELYEIEFTVIDSLTIGSLGGGTKDSDEVVKTLGSISSLGTVLIVDHTAKAATPPLRPIGPAMKYALGRSQIALSRHSNKFFKLEQSKPTFGPKPPGPTYLQIAFTELERQPPTVIISEALLGYDGLPREATIEDLIYQLLSGTGSLSTAEIANRLGKKEQGIRNALIKMKTKAKPTVLYDERTKLWSHV